MFTIVRQSVARKIQVPATKVKVTHIDESSSKNIKISIRTNLVIIYLGIVTHMVIIITMPVTHVI
jgi:hypothetical protein